MTGAGKGEGVRKIERGARGSDELKRAKSGVKGGGGGCGGRTETERTETFLLDLFWLTPKDLMDHILFLPHKKKTLTLNGNKEGV